METIEITVYAQMRLNDRDEWVTLPHPFDSQPAAERFCDDMNRYEQFDKYRVAYRAAN